MVRSQVEWQEEAYARLQGPRLGGPEQPSRHSFSRAIFLSYLESLKKLPVASGGCTLQGRGDGWESSGAGEAASRLWRGQPSRPS